MSGFGRVAGEAMVKCWLWRAGSRRLSMPKAEATGLAPKQSADAQDPLASSSEGFVLLHSPLPPCCAGSCQQAPAFTVGSAHRAHPLAVTLAVSAVFPGGPLPAAAVFASRIALVKSRS